MAYRKARNAGSTSPRRKALAAALALAFAAASGDARAAKYKVLNFFAVGGYAHDSRPVANKYLDSLAKAADFEVTHTESAAAFTSANLAQYRVVVLNNCTSLGKLLDTAQRRAFMDFARTRGVVAWHASSDIGGSFPEWASFLGGEFSGHGAGIATVRKDPGVAGHPLGGGPDSARFDEEWYSFKTNPRANPAIKVLYVAEEASCGGTTCFSPKMGTDHPVVWTRMEPQGGRLFYSAMGHFHHVFQKTRFTLDLYRQALDWAAAGTAAATAPITLAPSPWLRVYTGGRGSEVAVDAAGPHVLEVMGVDGRMLDVRRATGPSRHLVSAPAGSPRVISVRAESFRATRLLQR